MLAWPLLKEKREPGSHTLKYKSNVTFLRLSQRDLNRSRFFFADKQASRQGFASGGICAKTAMGETGATGSIELKL